MITIRLRELAEAKQMNKSQVQRRTGLTLGVVRRYWNSDTTSVDLRAIDKLCDLLDCQPGDLLQRAAPTLP